QREPEIVLRYLADMDNMSAASFESKEDWWRQGTKNTGPLGKETVQLSVVKPPAAGEGVLTLAEAALLYRAFFPPEEQIDLSNLRRRFLAMNRLEALDEERPVRGRELDWRRISRAYRYHE